ncbi:hypothetical protein CY35_12G093500 [Sphagnum magellanicum]|nr:hypothetical protein CY35_12G093500 [Sphagnum magellanicum]
MSSSTSEIGDIGKRRQPTFWQRLKGQRHGLGNMALAASVCILAVRLIDQDKQIQRLKDSESALITSLKRDNKRLMQRFDDLRDAVREEISRAGHRLPPLATRLQTLLDEKFNKDTQQQQTLPLEHPPAEEERGVAGLGMDTLQHPKKEKPNFMV